MKIIVGGWQVQSRSGWRLGFILPQLGDVDLEQSGSKVYANHSAICGYHLALSLATFLLSSRQV